MILGLLGGGQLAQMLALAGHPLGIDTLFIDPAADACAARVAHHLHGRFDDPALLQQLAERADVVSYEFESVPTTGIEWLASQIPVYPPPQALASGRDRLHEKQLFGKLGIPTAEYRAVNDLEQLLGAVSELGLPALLKSRREGYDGKGQYLLRPGASAAEAWQAVGGVEAILERLVPFQRELSIIAVRSREGEIRCYPLSENQHRNGILHLSIRRPDDPLQGQAEVLVSGLLQHLDYVGVIALELFAQEGRLLANEFAPRVHNSGHWTMEGALCSQFENHLRAIFGLPLGATQGSDEVAMVNFIGHPPASADLLAIPGLHLHLYGKEPRSGRKVGHATVRGDTLTTLQQRIDAVTALLAEG